MHSFTIYRTLFVHSIPVKPQVTCWALSFSHRNFTNILIVFITAFAYLSYELPKKYKNSRSQIQLSKIFKEIELAKFEGANRAGKVFPFETDYNTARRGRHLKGLKWLKWSRSDHMPVFHIYVSTHFHVFSMFYSAISTPNYLIVFDDIPMCIAL